MEIDEAEWQEAWQSMPNRRVRHPEQVHVDSSLKGHFGPVREILIALVPDKYVSCAGISSDSCPLCSGSTNPDDRLAAQLQLNFERIENIATLVWVHRQCFDDQEATDELPGFPY